jgi:predicted enzyme related to lactoylglutathione lyase
MRDCKAQYPDKRFFVINTDDDEYVKLEIFPMAHPVTVAAAGQRLLHGPGPAQGGTAATASKPSSDILGGNASIYVSCIDRAISFYTEMLGLPLRTRIGNEWAELDAGNGLVIGLHPARPPETVAPGVAGAINVELAVTTSLDEVVSTLEKRGVKFKGPIEKYENVHLAWLIDPDGNPLVLAQQVKHG